MCPHQFYYRGVAAEAEDEDEDGGEGQIYGGASLGISSENAAFNCGQGAQSRKPHQPSNLKITPTWSRNNSVQNSLKAFVYTSSIKH